MDMPITLYKKQKLILDFISQYIQKSGYSPTLQEIADAMGLSSLATVHEHIQALVRKGVVKRFEGTVRGIELIDERISATLNGIELPLVGYIAAGKPIEAMETTTETVFVNSDLVSKVKRCFVLQVKGDSMIQEGILDGDYVVVAQQNHADNGDIVVALIDENFATLKRYYKEKDRIRLQPANPNMQPIYAKNVKIQGRVTGVIRRYEK